MERNRAISLCLTVFFCLFCGCVCVYVACVCVCVYVKFVCSCACACVRAYVRIRAFTSRSGKYPCVYLRMCIIIHLSRRVCGGAVLPLWRSATIQVEVERGVGGSGQGQRRPRPSPGHGVILWARQTTRAGPWARSPAGGPRISRGRMGCQGLLIDAAH